jgi:O-antigen ligase
LGGDRAVHVWEHEHDWRDANLATRDLVGEPAHLIVAIFAMVMETLGTAPASIGFTTLCFVGILRAPVLWPTWQRMWRHMWIKMLVVWVLWCALSITWSPDRIKGIDRLWNLKYLAWLPLLWPLHRHWRWLLGGFLLAATVIQCIQFSGAVLGFTGRKGSLTAGLRHPTMAGMWGAMALSAWLFISVLGSWRLLFLSLPMAVLSAFGFFWASQRAALAGIIVEIVVANAVLAAVGREWIRKALIRALLAVLIIGVVYFFAGQILEARMKQVATELQASAQGGSVASMETRYGMWRLALEAWSSHPIVGGGLGSYQMATQSVMLRTSEKGADPHAFDTCHSTYFMVLQESGIIGLGLFLWWSILFAWQSVQYVRREPLRIAAFGGSIIWYSAAAFDSFNTRGVFLSAGVIMMTLSAMPFDRRQAASSPAPSSCPVDCPRCGRRICCG